MPAKNKFFNTIFFACYFLKVNLHYFLKIKSQKESQNSRIQDFSYYFCMMIEPDPDPYLGLVDPDQGGQKTRGSGTLLNTVPLLLCVLFIQQETNRIKMFVTLTSF